jgi:hypothetical protein
VRDEDAIDLAEGDFRRVRKYLAPWLFAWPGSEEGTTYPPPSDLVGQEQWDGIMVLPTDVALKSSSYEGSLVSRLYQLHSDWIFSWPDLGEATFMEEPALLASEEFDALVFNALHGWYRQALGCLRNALETLAIGAALAVTNDQESFLAWRQGKKQLAFGQCRALLRDSPAGRQIDVEAAPESVFGDGRTAWAKEVYARLCAYAHSRSGHTNADFWRSNGPIFSPSALKVVEAEFRETLALAYLLLRLGWAGYRPGPGELALISGPQASWSRFDTVLREWLLPTA